MPHVLRLLPRSDESGPYSIRLAKLSPLAVPAQMRDENAVFARPGWPCHSRRGRKRLEAGRLEKCVLGASAGAKRVATLANFHKHFLVVRDIKDRCSPVAHSFRSPLFVDSRSWPSPQLVATAPRLELLTERRARRRRAVSRRAAVAPPARPVAALRVARRVELRRVEPLRAALRALALVARPSSWRARRASRPSTAPG